MSTISRAGRRGRPREFDTDQALDDALDMFWHQGFDKTSTRQLEARLGITQSSLYNAFGSKRQLFEAALDRYERRVAEELVDPLAVEGGVDAVLAFLDGLLAWITADGRQGCMVINLMAGEGGDRGFAERTAMFRQRLREVLTDALAAEPGIARDAAADHADLVLTAALGLNIAARGGADRSELDRMVAAAKVHVDNWRV
jgi:AcrR family transcriptional regulator